MQGYFLKFKKHEVICREGDPSSDLYYLKSGVLLICTVHGTEVKALAKIQPGHFIGELSFFDGNPRSSHIVALEESEIVQIPKNELSELLPIWFLQVGINVTKKIRLLDQVVNESRIRKFSTQDVKPLSIEDQRLLLQAITH
jgi:CRP/FNR family transcriptional regulator, cyclic AMP receptor protein